MDQYYDIIVKLKDKGIKFDKGMSLQEISKIEKFYDISFPVELKKLYSINLPVSEGFYNWRDMSKENMKQIKQALELPLQGLQSDLESGYFWCEDWGNQPLDMKTAQNILLRKYNMAPKLVPIFSHRYIPFIPNDLNIPIFSIVQSDIIYYGRNLISYLEVEFKLKQYNNNDITGKYIDFWSDFI